MPVIQPPLLVYCRAWLELHMLGHRDERGSEAIEKVILAAVFAAAALSLGGIIVFKILDRANKIPVDAP